MAAGFDLLRHGDTGTSGFRGTLDDALTPLGWRQMREAVDGASWQVLVSSPRRRCAAFAQELAARLGVVPEIDERLAELDFGEWEGKTAEQLMQHDGEALQRFWQDPQRHAPPGGENFSAFSARVLGAWGELQERHAGKRVLLVTHAGVIRRLLCHARGLPLDLLLALEVPHGSLHRVSCNTAEGAR